MSPKTGESTDLGLQSGMSAGEVEGVMDKTGEGEKGGSEDGSRSGDAGEGALGINSEGGNNKEGTEARTREDEEEPESEQSPSNPPPAKKPRGSRYEREREANIARNEERLATLGFKTRAQKKADEEAAKLARKRGPRKPRVVNPDLTKRNLRSTKASA